MEENVRKFLSLSSGYGYGYGDGDGSGSGYGYGYGYGDGSGSGSGSGSGYGDGDGDGSGYGDGYGSGYGDGSGDGYGSGDGSGYGSGYGDGYGSGYGSGYGDGDGYGSGLETLNGEAVYKIDGVQTILRKIRGSVAKGCIVNSDLTLAPCYVVKQDNLFAHGVTLHEAFDALQEKLFEDMPEEDRIAAFVKEHEAGKAYPNTDFFSWHHRLTGSCEMGRRQFARDHGIDVEHGSMTTEDFIRLTENAYGSGTIRKLKQIYAVQ